jgi:hypothetical protein
LIALIAAALLGNVALIYEDAYHEYDHRLTRDDVAAYVTSPIPMNRCEALASSIRKEGGFAVCMPDE